MLNMAVLARSRPTSTYKPKICTVVYGDLFTGFDGTSSGNNNCVIESVSELCELAIRGASIRSKEKRASQSFSTLTASKAVRLHTSLCQEFDEERIFF
jgi:hypothetical protein